MFSFIVKWRGTECKYEKKEKAMWEQELGRNDGKITGLGIPRVEFEFCCSGSHLLGLVRGYLRPFLLLGSFCEVPTCLSSILLSGYILNLLF